MPYDASLAASTSTNSDPFMDIASNFIFGNQDDPSNSATQTPTSTADATSALGNAASSDATGTPGQSQSSGSSVGDLSVTTILLIGGLALAGLIAVIIIAKKV